MTTKKMEYWDSEKQRKASNSANFHFPQDTFLILFRDKDKNIEHYDKDGESLLIYDQNVL